jgi:primary-amine oxidase
MRALNTLLLGLVTTCALALPAAAQVSRCLSATPQPAGAPPNQIVQDFPAGSTAQTGWRITYGRDVAEGLYITSAEFRRSPSEPYITVLKEARLADIFAPYDPGQPRFFDLTGFNFALVPASSVDLGPCGTRVDPVVIKEIRDREMLWKNDTAGKRGQELVIWATLDASNYNYIMRYGFQDDGTITFRIGATAVNLPGHELVPHTHDGLWKIDVDLASPNNKVDIVRRLQSENSFQANFVVQPFNGGVEGYEDWVADEFTEVRITNPNVTNANGKPISYDLKPWQHGVPRHFEPFSHHDFWVTQYDPTETLYQDLPNYVSNRQPITSNDAVIWFQTSTYHIPRDEDGTYVSPNVWRGVALTMYSGFDLKPRNLFNTTPYYP